MRQGFPKKSIFVFVIAACLVIAMLACPGCSSYTDPGIIASSPVDVSILKPLKNYPGYSADELKARLDVLQEDESVQLQSTFGNDQVSIYDYYMDSGGVEVSFYIYGTLAGAKSGYESDKTNGPFADVTPKMVTVSQDVEAALYPIYWYRSTENFGRYTDPKCLDTEIRIGNMTISLSEQSDNQHTIGQSTNKALKQIVQVLE